MAASCFTRRVAAFSCQTLAPRTFSSRLFSATKRSLRTTFPNNKIDRSTAPLKDFVTFPTYALKDPPPDIVHLTPGRRVVCIGDVHGDYNALTEFLTLAGVLDTQDMSWIGGDTICIQLGDVLDRGHQELACLELLARLSRQAPADGGAIQLLFGNHEALNAVGLFQYTLGDEEFEENIGKPLDLLTQSSDWRMQFAGNSPVRWAALEPGGLLSETLCRNFKVAIVVGRTLCVHAGLTVDHLHEYGGIQGMNQQARDWITTQQHFQNNNNGNYATNEEIRQHAQARANAASATMPECLGGGIGSHSPVWMRDYSQPNDSPPRNPKAQNMMNAVLQELQCDRMVIGHTPQFKINAALQNKAWRIDVGASQGVMGGTPEVLEIIHGHVEDEVNILTKKGKVPAAERQTVDSSILF
jgi:hypothetical protein